MTRHQEVMADEFYYSSVAGRLVDGHGFTSNGYFGPTGAPVAEHPPLTSVLLAPWVWLSDALSDVPRFAVAGFGAVTVLLVGLLAREVAGWRTGLVAAAVAAVYPNLWVNDGLLMSETVATLATTLALWCAYRALRSPTLPGAALAGVAAASAGLARAELVLLVPLVAMVLLWRLRDTAMRRRLALAGAVVLAGLLSVAPWVGYNLHRFQRPVLFSTDGGTLLGANCRDTYAGHRLGFWDGLCTLPPVPDGDVSVRSAEMRDAAFTYMGDHLGRVPTVVAARVGRTWNVFRPFDAVEWNGYDGRPRWVSLSAVWSFWLVAALAVAGGVRLRRQRRSLLILILPVVVVTLATMAFYGRDRFRAPAEAPLVVMAAVALDRRMARPPDTSAVATVGRAIRVLDPVPAEAAVSGAGSAQNG